jgi:acyl-coenzyme A thioesterase PaaI-like protein
MGNTRESETPAEYVPDLSLWLGRPGVQDYPAEQEFGRLTAALRLLQDRVAAARPPGHVAATAADRLEELAALLGEFSVGEPEQVAARLMSEPGRGQTLIPALRVECWDGERVHGRMRFHRFHLGSNGAAHGGAISLFFDDLLGQLANAPGHPRARTAWIRVNYRRIIPIEHELVASAEVNHRHGRKLTVTGELRDGDDVVADAEGLFIQLRSDQP